MTFAKVKDFADLLRFPLDGYESGTSYRVMRIESAERTAIELELYTREEPFIKKWEPFGEDRERFEAILAEGNSYFLLEEGDPVGLFLLEKYEWNNCLNIELIEVVKGKRGRGYGRMMLDRIYEIARSMGVRAIRLEAQATNGAAIGFYRRQGYAVEGVDLSLYTNADLETQEVAVFMKRKLP
jgi:ribosomal protein S18 acetylase RimI-like enzyme